MEKYLIKLSNCGTSNMNMTNVSVDQRQSMEIPENSTNIINIENRISSITTETVKKRQETTLGNSTEAVWSPSKSNTDNKPTKRGQKFRSVWTDNYKWIEKRNNRGFCKICFKVIANNVSHIERHNDSKSHKRAKIALKNQPHINNSNKVKEFQSKIKKIKIAEIKIIVFLILHNLPFTLIGPLVDLVKSVAVDSIIVKDLKCGKTKATEVVNTILHDDCIKNLTNIMKIQKFSIIIDETTDVSTSKCLALVVRYFDLKMGKVRDRFLHLIELNISDAKTIYESIVSFFQEVDVPMENLIGFAADNAAVMMGRIKGVQALFKSNCNPNLYVIGCICHSINLCSSAATKCLPSEIESLARNIYTFFAHSSKRQKDFRQFQEYFDVKTHKILKNCSTRWLSLENVVSRILEQWQPLKYFFLYNEFEDNTDLVNKIQSSMNNETKAYFCFLSYALKITNKINIEFQSETPRFYNLLKTIKLFYKTILSNFVKMKYIIDNLLNEVAFDDIDIYKPIQEIYLGPKVEEIIHKKLLQEEEVQELRKQCREFYIILCKEILRRIDFEDPVLKAIAGIDPNCLAPSLIPLIILFPNLIDKNDIDALDEEWRLVQIQELVPKSLLFEEYWHSIFNITNALGDKMFPNLEKFISSLMCLPHSSASAERSFSQVNLIKTKTRNSLNVETVNSIMVVKETISDIGLTDWIPSKALINKYNK